jgi:glycosyltransferase involved in cell wall biosynthesis
MSEAREAGLAIIGTNVPGIPELLEFGEAGILISPGSPTEIAEKILYLFRDEDRLKVWKEKSQYRIDHLRVSRVAMETISVYKECVSRMKSV